MRATLRSMAVVLALWLAAAAPALAASAEDQFKADINAFLDKLPANTNGVLSWDGADKLDFQQAGDAVVATITNAKLSIHIGPDTGHLLLDHVEIRRTPVTDGGNAVRLAVTFPAQSTLTADGKEVRLNLKDAKASAVIDEASGYVRESSLSFASARLEVPADGDWVSFGRLSSASKVTGAADGGWSSTAEFELKQIEFFIATAPLSGALDRIAYSHSSAGPDLAAFDRLRDRIQALRQQQNGSPEEKMRATFELLQTIEGLLTQSKGELTVEGTTVRAATGEPLVALAKFSAAGALDGLTRDTASLRITLRHEGLTLSSQFLDPSKVPQRVVLDFGLESIETAPLRTILEIAAKLGTGHEDQQAQQRMMSAAAMLNPVFRIYEAAVETKDVGVEASAEAKGSPLAPRGYSAAADITVRGFDAVAQLLPEAPYIKYLPLLKVLGTAELGAGSVKFHLASAPQKWFTINGNDVTHWFAGGSGAAGQPRQLRPAEPPMQGPDVRAVQQALARADITVPQTGTYDPATAVAVATFQKRNGLNVDGVVDDATREKLGMKAGPGQPAAPEKPLGR
jgi:hypothetical protein